MPSTQGNTFAFGSNEGFEATHEAMLRYITDPRASYRKGPRNVFQMNLNLADATMLLNALELVIELHAYAQDMRGFFDPNSPAAVVQQQTRDWVEECYRDIASTVGVELI